MHNQSVPTTVKLSIIDEDDADEVISSSEIILAPNETKVVALTIEDLEVNNNYKFVAEGLSGIVFKNSSLLNVESKNCSLFILTDKAIYKPGETIKFRILVLDFNLKPITLDDSVLKVVITVIYWKKTRRYSYESIYIIYCNKYLLGCRKESS